MSSLSVHCQFTVSSPSVRYQFTLSSLSVHCQFTIISLPVHYHFTLRSLSVQSSLSVYCQCSVVHSHFTVSPLSVHNQLTVSSLSVHCQFTVNLLSVHSQFTVISLSVYYQFTLRSLSVQHEFWNSPFDIWTKCRGVGCVAELHILEFLDWNLKSENRRRQNIGLLRIVASLLHRIIRLVHGW